MLRLCWFFEVDQGPWATIARGRYLRADGELVNQLTSSIWTGIRDWHEILKANACWCIGDGTKVSFWTDYWLHSTIICMTGSTENFDPLAKSVTLFIMVLGISQLVLRTGFPSSPSIFVA